MIEIINLIMKNIGILSLVIFIISLFLLSIVIATQYSGDGTYTVKVNDILTANNGWKIEITTIVFTPSGEETLNFKMYDETGNLITEYSSVIKAEGEKKFGNNTHLKLKIAILGVSGESTPVSAVTSKYENAQIKIESIDELLPGIIEQPPSEIEEVKKELTYKHSVRLTLNVGDELMLGNGYRLVFDRFGAFQSPLFIFYDASNNLVDEVTIGNDVGSFFGSYIHVKNIDTGNNKIDILVENSSKITFGTGWNLFSIPLEDGDGYGTVLESTCNNASIWSWNNEIDDYEKIGKLEEGTKLPAKKGLWVKIKSGIGTSNMDCSIIVSGIKSVSLKGMKLKKGWNLISSPITAFGYREHYEGGSNFTFLKFNDIKGTCKIEKGPWQYLATTFIQVGGVQDMGDINKFSKPFDDRIRLFRGYFIKVTNDCELTDR